jgi:hypothetical protein
LERQAGLEAGSVRRMVASFQVSEELQLPNGRRLYRLSLKRP